jgi:hypothetical protein
MTQAPFQYYQDPSTMNGQWAVPSPMFANMMNTSVSSVQSLGAPMYINNSFQNQSYYSDMQNSYNGIAPHLNSTGHWSPNYFAQMSFNGNEYGQQPELYVNQSLDLQKSNLTKKITQPQSFRLSYQVKDRKSKKEAIKKEVEEKIKAECTFKPQITAYANSTKTAESRAGRFNQLSQSRKNDYLKREQEKKLEEEKRLQEECTFKPQIRRSKSAGGDRGLFNPEEVTKRLAREGENRTAKREMTKRELEEQQMQQFSFKPSTNKNKFDDASYRPVHERYGELQRMKNEKLKQLRIKSETENPDLKFVPEISKNSEKITKIKGTIPFQERIERSIHNWNVPITKELSYPRSEEIECTFQPQINPVSSKILKGSQLYTRNGGNFLNRQEIFQMRGETKRKMLEDKENRIVNAVPKITKTSKMIVEAKHSRAIETEEDKIERLAVKDKLRADALKEEIREQHYNQFNFKPRINDVSKTIARPTSQEELISNERNKKIKKNIADQLQTKFDQQYTFKPQLVSNQQIANSSKYRIVDLADPEKTKQRTDQLKAERELKLERAKAAQEYEEMKNCTFKPEISSNVAEEDDGPIVIRGLGRHLERTEKAKKMIADQKEREEQVFKPKVRDQDLQLNYTIPEPFNLHQDNDIAQLELKRKERQERQLQKEMEECTFQPKTNVPISNFPQLSQLDFDSMMLELL